MNTTATALEKAEQVAAKARMKADQLRREQAETAARAQAARDTAAAAFWDGRKADYVSNYGGRIAAAKDAFVDAVRTGGDVHAAWVTYRRTRVVVADEFQAFATVHAQRHDQAVQAKLDQLRELNQLAGFIDTTPRPDRGPAWHAQVEQWQALAGDYLDTTDPGQPRPLANDLPHFKMGRLGGLGGPDPDDDGDFTKAFAAAVRAIEAEAVAAHRDQRHDELAAAQDQAEREATS